MTDTGQSVADPSVLIPRPIRPVAEANAGAAAVLGDELQAGRLKGPANIN